MTYKYKHLVIDKRRAEATMNEYAKQGWRVVSFVSEDVNHNSRILLEKESHDR